MSVRWLGNCPEVGIELEVLSEACQVQIADKGIVLYGSI